MVLLPRSPTDTNGVSATPITYLETWCYIIKYRVFFLQKVCPFLAFLKVDGHESKIHDVFFFAGAFVWNDLNSRDLYLFFKTITTRKCEALLEPYILGGIVNCNW